MLAIKRVKLKNMSQISFKQTIDRSQAVARQWAEHDSKPWPVEVKVVDLNRIIGDLSSKVLRKRGFKKLDISDDATEELATMMFIILDIAQDLGVDLAKAYPELIAKFEQDLN